MIPGCLLATASLVTAFHSVLGIDATCSVLEMCIDVAEDYISQGTSRQIMGTSEAYGASKIGLLVPLAFL